MTVHGTERVVEQTLSRLRQGDGAAARERMKPVDVRGEAERQVVEALRARAIDGGGAQPGRPLSASPGSAAWPIGTALLVALLAGAALGIGLALLSVLVPGLLPAFG